MFDIGFPRDWSSLKKLIWLKAINGGGGGAGVWKTVTGALIHITDALASPVRELSVAIEPQQSGSGDPSPTNVRPITGWTGCNIYRSGADTSNPTTYPISWQTEAGTVYGGTLTVNEDGSGTLIKKYKMVDGGNQSWKKVSSNYFRNFTFSWETAAQDNEIATVWSSNYKGVASNNGATQDGDSYVWMRAAQSGSDQLCCVKDTSKASMTAAEFKSAMSGVQFLALLKEEEWTTYTLTAQQISTIAGENNIWADVNGEITLTYQAVPETAFSDSADTGMADYMTLTE